ncbi:MAG TPA: hypothetical protein VJ783_11995 [Pirellulales bacterium]|nr:hypothetical protein [Pirellulales bacterium]
MTMLRPRFTIRALLVLMLAVGCFFGGMAVQRRLDDNWAPAQRISWGPTGKPPVYEEVTFPDGTRWKRVE